MLCKIYQIQLWKANLKKIGSSFGLHNYLFSAWFISWMNQGNLFQGKRMKHSSLFNIKHSVWCVKWVVQKKKYCLWGHINISDISWNQLILRLAIFFRWISLLLSRYHHFWYNNYFNKRKISSIKKKSLEIQTKQRYKCYLMR